MPEVESAEVLGDAPADDGTTRRRPWMSGAGGWTSAPGAVRRLTVALIAAVVVAVALGGWLLAGQWRAAPQREAVSAARAWVRAVDRHDLAALQVGTVRAARAVVLGRSGTTGSSDRPFRGRVFVSDGELTFAAGLQLQVLGEPVAISDHQVAMTTHLVCPDGDEATHLTVVSLTRVDEQLKVSSVLMTPQEVPA